MLHALNLFEKLQTQVAENADSYGQALAEIEKQLENIQSEFSQFVTLNSSGDPVEAAEILDKAEDHILALTHIVEKVPAIVEELTVKLPDQLEDLESGHRKLLESGYHFIETNIESTDFRHPAICLRQETGSRITDFIYVNHQIINQEEILDT